MNSYANNEGITMNNPVRQAISQFVMLLLLLGVSAGVEAATLTVANNNDSGAGSLRQAVLNAAASDTIDFSAGITTITLTSGEISISKNLTINGLGARILTISGNDSSRIFNITAGTVVVNGVTLTNGNAPGTFPANGGAILNSGDLTLNKVAVINSRAPSTGPPGNGGGIANSGTITLNDVTVSGNSAASSGGGIYNDSNTMLINNSTISGNSSFNGGGIYNYSGGSDLTLKNSTITNNITTNNNSAALDHDFGILLSIYNTIIDGNIDTNANPSDLLASITPPTLVHNSIVGAMVPGTTLGGDQIGNRSGPAQLEPLLNNGGPTDTHAPRDGSPALNAGDVATCLLADQRGITRPLASCDIGAVEPTCKWSNPSGGAWGTGGNWDCGHIPDGADHVNITSAGTYAVNLNQAATVLDMVLGDASGVQTLSVTGGSDFSLTLHGASTIAAGGSLSVKNAGSQVSAAGLLTNNGSITLDNSTYLVANLKNNGTLTVTGANPSTLSIGGFSSTNSGIIIANGPFNISMTMGGSFTNSGTIDTGAGNSVTLKGTGAYGSFTNSSGGVVMGTGAIDVTDVFGSSFSNAGEIRPATPGANGMLSFTGGINMAGTNALYIDVSGAGDYDQVSVSGAATINGSLNVSLLNGYNPAAGDSFTIMNCGSGCDSGVFSPILPVLAGGKAWNIVYNPTKVVLSVFDETVAPTDNGSLSAVAGDGKVNLSWSAATDSGSGVATYLLAVSTATTPSPQCTGGSDLTNVTSYIHAGAVNGTTYYYRLCAKDMVGNISTGLIASATPVALLTQTISFGAPPSLTYGGGTGTVSATATSALPVTFSSLTSSVCTISGSTVTPVSAGTCTIAAYQAGDGNYAAAPQVTQDITIAKVTAMVTLGNLSQTFDGTLRSVTAMTNPVGKTVLITYDGSIAAPINAGSYTVEATISDSDYTGSASGTLIIAKAAASVTLSNLSQAYAGTAKSATAMTSPAGKTVTFTYNGSATAPTSAGSYAVVGTINDTNYSGSANGTLVIDKATAIVTLGNLSQTFDGSAKAATATTNPVGKAVTFTYDGVATAPVSAGTYAVVATISDADYTGTASGSLVIGKATPSIAWTSPAAITYGTLLSSTQLNASASVPGAYVYTPGVNTILTAGTQTLSVSFTPSDTTNFTTQTATVNLTVNALPANQTTTGPDGRTTVPVTVPVPGASITLPTGTLLKDAFGNPIIGTLTVAASVSSTLPTVLSAAPAADGKVLSVLGNSIDITISAGGSTVKTITPDMTVNLAVAPSFALPGATVSCYSFDGTKWKFESDATVKADGTVDMLVTHLSVWAIAKFTSTPTVDVVAPRVNDFHVEPKWESLSVPISAIDATDDIGVAKYLVTDSVTPPLATDPNWNAFAPTEYKCETWGNHTISVYAKDAAENISVASKKRVYIGYDPDVDGVLIPAQDGSQKYEPTVDDALKSLRYAMKLETPNATQILHGKVAPLVNGLPNPDTARTELNLGDTIVILRRAVGL